MPSCPWQPELSTTPKEINPPSATGLRDLEPGTPSAVIFALRHDLMCRSSYAQMRTETRRGLPKPAAAR